MKKNTITYQRFTVLDNIIEISIPTMFKRIEQIDEDKDKEYALWTRNDKELIALYKIEFNQYPLRDIIQIARSQMITEKHELKNLGVYSCVNNNVEKYMSEDELIFDETNSYIISCAFRYKDMSFIIYCTGDSCLKSSIKENMMYTLDSIIIDIKD